MSCIENINRYIFPNDVINSLTNIYKYIGKNDLYQEITVGSMNKIVEQTIQRDAFFLGKILKIEISDTRLRLIITKNSTPRNKEENTLFTILEILNDIQTTYKKYSLQSTSLLNMINYIYENQSIKFDNRTDLPFGPKDKREFVDYLSNELETQDDVEKITLYLNYFIDMYNAKPFTSNNDTLTYLVLYIVLLKANIDAFKYISLFEMIYNDFDDFKAKLLDASYNWREGISQPTTFIRYMLKLIVASYRKADGIITEYKIDQNITKCDNIENTIYSLPNIFTKDQIRADHPYVSETTINRALQKLRDENKIKPLGKGRSAKWIKISLL